MNLLRYGLPYGKKRDNVWAAIYGGDNMDFVNDPYARAERTHRLMEKYGGERRDRVSVEIIGGNPILLDTRFDGAQVRIVDQEALPHRLAPSLSRLRDVSDSWLDRLSQVHRRQGNIINALEGAERLTRSLRGRAIACTGTKYLTHRISNLVLDALQKVANFPGDADGVVQERLFEVAGMEIHRLLVVASCRRAA